MLNFDRKYLVIMMEAGYIYLGMQRFQEAMEVFEGIALLAPESEVPVVALGSVAFCQGDFKGAIKHYEEALKLDPQSSFAKVYLGEALFFSGKRQEALKLLKEVYAEDRGGPAGDFAVALLEAIENGFTPTSLGEETRQHAASKTALH